jgi:hypothetical protein
MAACLVQIQNCHGWLCGAGTVLSWLPLLGHVQYCTVVAACLAQVQKCHGWLCRTGTVQYGAGTVLHGYLSGVREILRLPVWRKYRTVIAAFVRQVQ